MQKTFTAFLIIITCIEISCDTSTRYASDHKVWADTVAERATNLMSGENPSRSLHFLDSAYISLGKPGIGDLWKKYNVKVNYYTYYDQDPGKRRIYIDSMLYVIGKVKEQYNYEYTHSLFAMAGLLQQEKKYNQAFRVYHQGRTLARTIKDDCSTSEFSNALGVIRYRQDQYTAAIPYLKQAYEEIQRCSKKTFLHSFIQPQSILNTIALCFEKAGKADSAKFYYNRALNFIIASEKLHPQKRDFITTARAVVEGNLGGVYAKTGDFKRAEQHLLTNIHLNDRPGFSIEDSQTAKIKLTRLYIEHGVFEKASLLLNDLHSDLTSGRGKSISHADIWEKWYELKWLYSDKTGNLSQAYKYSNKYRLYRDSLDQINNGLKNVDMDQVIREQDQKHRLSLLEKSGELKSVYMIGLSVFLVMAMIVAIVTWLNYRRSRVHVKKLTSLNDQMQQTLSALENSQNENSRLMKVVAHDLRNPVAAMVSLAGLMLMDTDRCEDDLHYLNLIKDSGNNSLELIGNLLHLNTPVTSEPEKNEVDLADLVSQCADLLTVRAAQKQQLIRLNLEPTTLNLNYGKMWRVINNLIYNAIKFSPAGTTIDICLESDSKFTKLTVKDQGIGIPEDFGNKIFDAFTDSKRKGTNGEESFGLGLSITKQIIEAHGGEITFDSAAGQGTTFTILIPIAAADKQLQH